MSSFPQETAAPLTKRIGDLYGVVYIDAFLTKVNIVC